MPEVSKNKIVYGDGFLRDVRKLPKEVQSKLADLLTLLALNAFDSRLHSKALGIPLEGVYSFRVTRDWRVGFIFIASHEIKLLAVDNRDAIYQRLKRLLGK